MFPLSHYSQQRMQLIWYLNNTVGISRDFYPLLRTTLNFFPRVTFIDDNEYYSCMVMYCSLAGLEGEQNGQAARKVYLKQASLSCPGLLTEPTVASLREEIQALRTLRRLLSSIKIFNITCERMQQSSKSNRGVF